MVKKPKLEMTRRSAAAILGASGRKFWRERIGRAHIPPTPIHRRFFFGKNSSKMATKTLSCTDMVARIERSIIRRGPDALIRIVMCRKEDNTHHMMIVRMEYDPASYDEGELYTFTAHIEGFRNVYDGDCRDPSFLYQPTTFIKDGEEEPSTFEFMCFPNA
jgi:hypothetical protein